MKSAQETIREAVTQYGPWVVRRCRAFTSDRETADDLAQEVFSRICEVATRPERDRGDIPWKLVESITRNVFLEYLRQKKRRTPLVDSEMDAMPANQDEPSETMLTEDWKAQLRTLVDRLSVPEQQAVLGRHFLGLNTAELTRLLGLPRTTVVDCYNRGISRLREMARDHGLLP